LLREHPVIFWPDSDAPGEGYIARAAAAIRAENPSADLRVVRPFPMAAKGEKGHDVCDWHWGAEELTALAKSATPYEQEAAKPESDDEFNHEIKRLAALDHASYERQRREIAKKLQVRAPVLDKLVAAERGETESLSGNGAPLELTIPEAWPEPVAGGELLDEIETLCRRFIVCEPRTSVALALWIVATWFADYVQVAPILNVKSPTARCGKTTTLDIVGRLSRRSLMAAYLPPPCFEQSKNSGRR
jgi:hypothetical protein